MRRREDRNTLEMNAHCRSARAQLKVTIHNVSCHGCRISGSCLSVEEGQIVVLKTVGLEGLTGTVKWSQDDAAGVEFDTPLHPAVADHLCRNNVEGTAQVSEASAA